MTVKTSAPTDSGGKLYLLQPLVVHAPPCVTVRVVGETRVGSLGGLSAFSVFADREVMFNTTLPLSLADFQLSIAMEAITGVDWLLVTSSRSWVLSSEICADTLKVSEPVNVVARASGSQVSWMILCTNPGGCSHVPFGK